MTPPNTPTILLINETNPFDDETNSAFDKLNYIKMPATEPHTVNMMLSSAMVGLIVFFYDKDIYSRLTDTFEEYSTPILYVFEPGTPDTFVRKVLGVGKDFMFTPFLPVELVARVEGLLLRKEKRDNLQKKVNEELKAQNQQLTLITDNIPLMIAQVDIDLNYLFTNQAYADFYRKTKRELLHKNIKDVLLPEYYQQSEINIRKVLNGDIVQFLHEWRSVYGKERFYNVTLIPQFNDNRVVSFYVLEFDITRLKKKELALIQHQEQLKEANEELIKSNEAIKKVNEEVVKAKEKAEKADGLKTAFLRNISHEIRTPMNAVLGFSSLLCEPNITTKNRQQFAEIISQKGNHLISIIDDIIDISEIETGLIKLYERKVSIESIFEKVSSEVQVVSPFEIKSPVVLRMIKSPECEIPIIADEIRLGQILKNLLSNALKFTHEGFVEYGCALNEKNMLQFYVKDTGVGIRPENQKIIFDRFRQSDDHYQNPQYGGTGLGLSISKGMVDLMKGEIWLESELGVGSTFYFTIPYQPVV